MRKPESTRNPESHAKRVEQLEVAFAAFRRTHGQGHRIPPALRAQVVSALNEGVAERRLRMACRLSWSQLRRWRSVPHARLPPAPVPRARVLSVVDADFRERTHLDGGIEIKVGPWHVSLSRSIG